MTSNEERGEGEYFEILFTNFVQFIKLNKVGERNSMTNNKEKKMNAEYYLNREYTRDSSWILETTAFLVLSRVAFCGWVGYHVYKLIAAALGA